MILFFIPLSMIALWETQSKSRNSRYTQNWFGSSSSEEEEEDVSNQNPEVDEDGKTISKVSFDQLTKTFPDAHLVSKLTFLLH